MGTIQTTIAGALFGKTRQAILSLLFGHSDESFYLRQITRYLGSGMGAVQRELNQLVEAGIIRRFRQGNLVYFRDNPDCPIYDEIKNLIRKTSGLAIEHRLQCCLANSDCSSRGSRLPCSTRISPLSNHSILNTYNRCWCRFDKVVWPVQEKRRLSVPPGCSWQWGHTRLPVPGWVFPISGPSAHTAAVAMDPKTFTNPYFSIRRHWQRRCAGRWSSTIPKPSIWLHFFSGPPHGFDAKWGFKRTAR